MPTIKPEFVSPIRRDVRRVVTTLCRELAEIVKLNMDIKVIVVPAPAVHEGGKYGFGAFLPVSHTLPNYSRIYLAGQCPKDINRGDWCDSVAETLCHELAHHEQWRDGRELTERGVAVRARSLLARTSYKPAGAAA